MKGAGKALENRIQELSVTIYPQQKLRLYKNTPSTIGHPTYKKQMPDGTSKRIPTTLEFAKRRQSEAPVDFFGYFHNIIVMLEVKAIGVDDLKQWEKARFPIGDVERIPEHQQKALVDCELANGLAFYLIWIYAEPALLGTYFLLSPGWAEFVCNSLNAPVTIALNRFKSNLTQRFVQFDDLAELPKVLGEITKAKGVR